MPLNLDSCIGGVFTPGNIPASSGLPPIKPIVPSLDGPPPKIEEIASATDTLDSFMGSYLYEAAHATDSVTATGGAFVLSISEAAAATDAPYLSQTYALLVGERAENVVDDVSVHEPTVYTVSLAEATAAADVPNATVTPGMSAEVSQFLARTSGLDATHTNAYTALIDGLVADGIWAKLDRLCIFATQNQTTALLNLVSSSYGGITHNSPTFTADRGFTGNGTSTYIETQFIPSSASSPKFVQNSCHTSTWNLTNSTSTGIAIGNIAPARGASNMHPKYTDGNAYFRISGSAATSGVAMSDARGHFIANRSGASSVQGYKNGSSVLTNSDTSVAVCTVQFYDLAYNNNGPATDNITFQIAASSIGSSLSGTDATNFYNRLRTYMTAVGVP